MAVKTYRASAVSVIVGSRIIKGFADGTFIKAMLNDDNVKMTVGARGDVARAVSSDESGEITMTLLQTSEDNQFFSELAIQDRLDGSGVVNVFIKDQNGRSLHEAKDAWIKKTSDAEYGKEITNREWVFSCAQLIQNVGGN